jgi:flavin reductase (DIM6/NTAB) family NADH-FMN oxidoreductase RutF
MTHDEPNAHSSLARVLGRIPSGLYILTISCARDGQEPLETGMLASWVMQAGFDPPMVTVVVRKGRFVADWLAKGYPFVLNLLADDDKALMRHYGKGFEPGQPAFTGVELQRDPRGVPVLNDALGHLECEVVGKIDSGDHHVFMAKVIGGHLAVDEAPAVHIRKSGTHY